MLTILVIEDEEFLRNNIVKMLQLKGYTCYAAINGIDGVTKAKQILPNIIVCDVMMPGIDGFEVLTQLKADITTQNIPFIFLTARADAIDKNRGNTLGASLYLTKPFSIVDLLKAVQSFQ
ncbi:MAG: response regulator [Bacteroidetes bacterium]|nr:response regulator [Bacteroidota bacterium]MBS1648626.1 response regulator [Bacteroidota bacterium]